MIDPRGADGLLDESIGAALSPVLRDLEYLEEPPSSPLALEELFAHYERVRQLGRGGMSTTHLVRERTTGRLVCLKQLDAQVDRRVLIQEYKALSRMSHPNIVRMIALETRTSHPVLVMEYVEGTDIREHVAQLPARDEATIAAVMLPVIDAVEHLHRAGVIHRDLKPENILMATRDGLTQAVVLDLGLAIVDDFDHEQNFTAGFAVIVRGTPCYMAPEQIEGQVLTPACDVYALGVILYELATGHNPFSGPLRAVVQAKMSADTGLILPGSETSWLRRKPRRWPVLGKLVRECTNPNPKKRPTAAEFAARLGNAIH